MLLCNLIDSPVSRFIRDDCKFLSFLTRSVRENIDLFKKFFKKVFIMILTIRCLTLKSENYYYKIV